MAKPILSYRTIPNVREGDLLRVEGTEEVLMVQKIDEDGRCQLVRGYGGSPVSDSKLVGDVSYEHLGNCAVNQ